MGCRDEFQPRNFGLDHPEPIKFSKAQWSNFSNVLFLCWRVFWTLWHLAWLVVSIYEHGEDEEDVDGHVSRWLIYLTSWSYLVLTIQSCLHLGVVIYHTSKGHKEAEQFGDSTQWFHKALWIFTSISFIAAIVVSILYWGLIFKKLEHVLNIVTHGVTSFYAITDIFISATPWRLLHVIYPMIYAFFYIIFTIIYHLADGNNVDGDPFVYEALDWSNTGPTAGLVLGVVFVAVPVIHLFYFGLYKLRVYMYHSCCGGGGKGSFRSRGNAEIAS